MTARFTVLLLVSAFVFAATLRGDTVHLVNGDAISGKVVSLDAKVLKLKSDALGELSIDRVKIATIHLGDMVVPKPQPAAPNPAANPVLDQLRNQGIDPQTINDIKKTFPLLATPAAGKYFDNALSGLMNGTLGVQDIRKDAQKALDEVKKLEKDLGPQATQGLQAYVGILESFLRDSAPAKKPQPAPNQKK